MTRFSRKTSAAAASGNTTKYDAHHRVLAKAYGSQADLRRELSDSKAAVAERTRNPQGLRRLQRPAARLAAVGGLFRETFPLAQGFRQRTIGGQRLFRARGKKRLEETAILFMRFNRPLPTELQPHANPARFAEIEQAEKDQRLVQQLETGSFQPPRPSGFAPRRHSRRLPAQAGGGVFRFARLGGLLSTSPATGRVRRPRRWRRWWT